MIKACAEYEGRASRTTFFHLLGQRNSSVYIFENLDKISNSYKKLPNVSDTKITYT